MINQNNSSESIVVHGGSASIDSPGHSLGHSLGGSFGWYCLGLLLIGWLSGLLFSSFVAPSGLPDYELAVENQSASAALALSPMSYLSIALMPKEGTSGLPHLCGFIDTGAALDRWPVAYRLSHDGTLFIKGEVRDLLPLPAVPQRAVKELVFLVSSRFGLCPPSLARALQALERLTDSRFSRRASSWLGVQLLRLPIAMPPAAP